MKYRKKPVVIEAIQWTGENYNQVCKFVGKRLDIATGHNDVGLMIRTLEGTMFASQGDYIIRGIKGEYYPCKPDIFEETYEETE